MNNDNEAADFDIELTNEFASVRVRRVHTRNGVRLELTSIPQLGVELPALPLIDDLDTGMQVLKIIYRAGFTNPWHCHPCAHVSVQHQQAVQHSLPGQRLSLHWPRRGRREDPDGSSRVSLREP